MDISTLTEDQTKARIYDQLAFIEGAQNNIKLLNNHLQELQNPVKSSVVVTEETSTTDVKEVPEKEENAINEQPVAQA